MNKQMDDKDWLEYTALMTGVECRLNEIYRIVREAGANSSNRTFEALLWAQTSEKLSSHATEAATRARFLVEEREAEGSMPGLFDGEQA